MTTGVARGRSLDREGIQDAQVHWNLVGAVPYGAARNTQGQSVTLAAGPRA